MQKMKVIDTFMNQLNKTGVEECTSQQLQVMLKSCDVILERNDIDYIVMHLYSRSKDVDKLKYFQLLDHLNVHYVISSAGKANAV